MNNKQENCRYLSLCSIKTLIPSIESLRISDRKTVISQNNFLIQRFKVPVACNSSDKESDSLFNLITFCSCICKNWRANCFWFCNIWIIFWIYSHVSLRSCFNYTGPGFISLPKPIISLIYKVVISICLSDHNSWFMNPLTDLVGDLGRTTGMILVGFEIL